MYKNKNIYILLRKKYKRERNEKRKERRVLLKSLSKTFQKMTYKFIL